MKLAGRVAFSLCILHFALCTAASALDYRPAFLEISTFGRPLALGGAYTGISDDAAGIFFNSAGPRQDGLRFALTDWYIDTRLASGAGALRLGNVGMLSAGLNYLSYGDMTRWDDQGNVSGQFSAYSLCGKVAFNHTFVNVFSAGVGLGYIAEKVDDWNAGAMGVDAGVRAAWPQFGAGFAIRDFASTKVPFAKALGIYGRPIKQLLISAEVEHTDHLNVRAGAEFTIDVISLRGGYDGANPCFGLGLKMKQVTLDYAGVFHNRLGLVHQLSLGVNR
jgi:hypothetical protein